MRQNSFVITIFLLVNTHICVHSQDSQEEPKDSTRVALELNRAKSTYINQPDSSLIYARNVVSWSEKLNRPWQKAWGLKMIGVNFQMSQDFDSAIHYFKSSLELFEAEKDTLEIGKSQLSIAQMYLGKGFFDEALVRNLSARDFFEAANDFTFLSRVYDAIAQIYSATDEHKQALPYFHKSYSLTQIRKDTFNMAIGLANLATVHNNLKNPDSVTYYYNQAEPLLVLTGNRYALANLQQTMGNLFTRSGDFRQAEKLYQDALDFYSEAGIRIGMAQTYLNYGMLKDTIGQVNKAIEYIEKSLTLSRADGVTEIPMFASNELKVLYAKLGNYKKAFQTSLVHDTLRDNFMSAEKQQTIANYETSFRTKEKEQQIALQQLSLDGQKVKLERNQIVIVGLIIVSLLLMVIVFLVRNRAAKNQDLIRKEGELRLRQAEINAVINSQEKERNRFARDLHDGFGQLISVLKLNLSQLNEVTNRDMEKRAEVFKNGESVINEMFTELRNICFDLMPQTLVKRGLTSALKEFGVRINQTEKVKCEVLVFDNNERLPSLVEVSLFRITQEWVNNILKYADASVITIQITRESSEVTLTLEDNGVGFNSIDFFEGKGNGWRNIQTRLKQVSGTFDLDTALGRKGTMVTINSPISAIDNQHAGEALSDDSEEALTVS